MGRIATIPLKTYSGMKVGDLVEVTTYVGGPRNVYSVTGISGGRARLEHLGSLLLTSDDEAHVPDEKLTRNLGRVGERIIVLEYDLQSERKVSVKNR